MHLVENNILIFKCLLSYTCFEADGSSSGRWLYIQSRYSVFYMHQYKQFCWCVR